MKTTTLDLATRWRWVVSFTPRPLYSQYPLGRRLGGPMSRSGRCPCRESNPAVQPITIPTESSKFKWVTILIHIREPRIQTSAPETHLCSWLSPVPSDVPEIGQWSLPPTSQKPWECPEANGNQTLPNLGHMTPSAAQITQRRMPRGAE
jgi:hypothetical protein